MICAACDLGSVRVYGFCKAACWSIPRREGEKVARGGLEGRLSLVPGADSWILSVCQTVCFVSGMMVSCQEYTSLPLLDQAPWGVYLPRRSREGFLFVPPPLRPRSCSGRQACMYNVFLGTWICQIFLLPVWLAGDVIWEEGRYRVRRGMWVGDPSGDGWRGTDGTPSHYQAAPHYPSIELL